MVLNRDDGELGAIIFDLLKMKVCFRAAYGKSSGQSNRKFLYSFQRWIAVIPCKTMHCIRGNYRICHQCSMMSNPTSLPSTSLTRRSVLNITWYMNKRRKRLDWSLSPHIRSQIIHVYL